MCPRGLGLGLEDTRGPALKVLALALTSKSVALTSKSLALILALKKKLWSWSWPREKGLGLGLDKAKTKANNFVKKHEKQLKVVACNWSIILDVRVLV